MAGNVGRPSGLAKTGGRKKGTPNKATQKMREVLAEIDCNPLLELARIALDHKTPIEQKIRIFSELLPYVYPKRKPTDDSRNEPTTINVNTVLDISGSDTEEESDARDQHQPEA